VYLALRGHTAEAGRALQQFKMIGKARQQMAGQGTTSQAELLEKIGEILGGRELTQEMLAKLAALNTQYTQRVERTRVFDVRSRTESQHVRHLRWSYLAWVLAYLAVVVACVVLIVFKQDLAIFVLAATILAVAVASYVVAKIDLL
jgi:hypothetical protein